MRVFRVSMLSALLAMRSRVASGARAGFAVLAVRGLVLQLQFVSGATCSVVAAHGDGLMVPSPPTPQEDIGNWRERAPPEGQQQAPNLLDGVADEDCQ